ncbi:hypothetical protein BDV28DRAFT_26600 [Aspergillus coremiiformis]|uniref:Uncharacterized protein n=1 Tax=Aspergillus coremiiformis TaxID=138285 RepID=A0A5N6Z248_9EURO|nr:hypothetical protein BDV28DRAFT_26600 [Aspergillus coremiiformis]
MTFNIQPYTPPEYFHFSSRARRISNSTWYSVSDRARSSGGCQHWAPSPVHLVSLYSLIPTLSLAFSFFFFFIEMEQVYIKRGDTVPYNNSTLWTTPELGS